MRGALLLAHSPHSACESIDRRIVAPRMRTEIGARQASLAQGLQPQRQHRAEPGCVVSVVAVSIAGLRMQ
jgi:hypothetical protein